MINMAKKELQALVAEQKIVNRIYVVRAKDNAGWRLSEMYNVETRRLNEQVKRNANLFPKDFSLPLLQKNMKT